MLVVELITRRACCLCDTAKFVLKRIPIPLQIQEVDITPPFASDDLRRLSDEFTNDIPVVRVNGQVLMKGIIKQQPLEDELRKFM